jgi:hypothetical protein
MESTFQFVVFGAVALTLLMSIVFLLSKGSAYDDIGKGQLGGEGQRRRASAGQPQPDARELAGPPGNDLLARPERERFEADQEIRQMLQARSERLQRRGEPGLDIDAEVARLTAYQATPQRDPGIEEEVLQLVVARNERRERQGLEPLDIEAEVARTLAEFDV